MSVDAENERDESFAAGRTMRDGALSPTARCTDQARKAEAHRTRR